MIKISPSYAALSKSANDAWTYKLPSGHRSALNGNARHGNAGSASADPQQELEDGGGEVFALKQQLWVLLLVPVLLVLLFKPADQQTAIAEHSEWVASPSMSLRFPGQTATQASDTQLPLPATGLLQGSYRCGAHFDTPTRATAHCVAPVRKLIAVFPEHRPAMALMTGG